ncbi:tRNA (adenosine(37)-N6)-threonylcarbamoyltransferase complex dimerization subunit type 1 TsaB [Fructobacillus sp. M2-14]|uniref:tRNA (Adenosine(37)-N6)-threonylcarbamoyltransferase complex dimerization subunit type 1 TsaB n=1 Tax=Fructobacillus broussonetiae TaxID=2713173 RepID=A0ABS5QZC8_9LACO|nr:tRNA (adenosine(37)-N6)-threonylcarbamoyltransferase complex dimerization subunit type 1 TsaB [Fructobacillus broussonetiae]MBS9338553.1 tRNA (adenosine(37)-N6)-threonylcarbamoyltransferase complex dimerization subunit type 1 TsaB [Fructobacillus broussonetiae]
MKVLAIDTSNQPLLVALAEDGQILSSVQTNKPKNHSVDLLPAVKDLLAKEGWTLQDLDQIAIAKGPGSFTGLRIGVTVGKVLADTLNKPLLAISSLQALARQVQLANWSVKKADTNLAEGTPFVHKKKDSLVLALFDARNDNVFAGAYLGNETVLEDGHYPIDEVLDLVAQVGESLIVVGDGMHFEEAIKEELSRLSPIILTEDESLPDGTGLVDLAKTTKPVEDVANLTPSYLRKTQAELNWEKNQAGKPLDKPYVFEV